MRRNDAVAESASRRLAELAVRLDRAGVPRAESGPAREGSDVDPRVDPPIDPGDVAEDERVEPAVVVPPGRHVGGRSRVGSPPAEWLADRTPPWLLGRVALGGGHLAALALVAVAAVGLTVWLLHRPSAPVERVDAAAAAPPVASPSPAEPEALVTPVASGAAATGTPATVVVDVAGKVRRPGVLTLPAGSRVTDAITEAGGPRAGVGLTSLNLARVLVDGEQILVGVAPAGGVAAPAAGSPSAGGAGPLVNLNTATLAELDTLPGVGPVTAQRILDWRSSHGAFSSVDELLEIDGIGEKTLGQMASRVTL